MFSEPCRSKVGLLIDNCVHEIDTVPQPDAENRNQPTINIQNASKFAGVQVLERQQRVPRRCEPKANKTHTPRDTVSFQFQYGQCNINIGLANLYERRCQTQDHCNHQTFYIHTCRVQKKYAHTMPHAITETHPWRHTPSYPLCMHKHVAPIFSKINPGRTHPHLPRPIRKQPAGPETAPVFLSFLLPTSVSTQRKCHCEVSQMLLARIFFTMCVFAQLNANLDMVLDHELFSGVILLCLLKF